MVFGIKSWEKFKHIFKMNALPGKGENLSNEGKLYFYIPNSILNITSLTILT